MRTSFIKTVEELAARDKDIFFVTGDLGYNVIENFVKKFPAQFVNAGVAEQNMTGMAAGMALSGKTVFTYSIANFPSLRPLEHIRNDICYNNANVKIVSIGAGFQYGGLGASHHATEDIAIMRALPNMVVISPADGIDTELATKAIVEYEGPCYLRLGIDYGLQEPYDFEIGKAHTPKDGKDITLISTGNMLKEALKAAEELEKEGIEARVLNMH
ncbi:transketolase, partial [Patescibacteria group bacterium]|nr:transketolase [Patescibacteria group bacterium]